MIDASLKLPPRSALYFKALKTLFRKGRHPLTKPISGPWWQVSVDQRELDAFRAHCEWTQPGLPITWLFVLAGSPQVALLADRRCPYPAPGLIHTSVRLKLALPGEYVPDAVRIRATLSEAGVVEAGRDLKMECELQALDGSPVGNCTSTLRFRNGNPADRKHRAQRPHEVDASETTMLSYSKARGRQYAKISGDYNPIHLAVPTARLFGFRRPIAHGMDSLARCLAAVTDRPPVFAESRFRRPVFLPATTRLHGDRGSAQFALLSDDTSTVHLEGEWS